MKTLTNFLIVVDFFLTMGLVVFFQIGCMTATKTDQPNANMSNVIVAPTTTAYETNSVIDRPETTPSFNTEHYVWEDWNIK